MEFRYLSHDFFRKYNNCPEILMKPNRPYAILVIDIENRKFAIPLRSHLGGRTRDCFVSNTVNNSGLDFTKSVFIEKETFLENAKFPTIQQKEYNFIKFKEIEIKIAFQKFYRDFKKDYIRHQKNPNIPPNPGFKFVV